MQQGAGQEAPPLNQFKHIYAAALGLLLYASSRGCHSPSRFQSMLLLPASLLGTHQ